MATRFYFPAVASNTSGLTPAFDSWNTTSEAARCDLKSTKGSSAITTGTQIGPWTATAGQNALDRQFISSPLSAQTISGTFSLMLMTREYATTDNVDRVITGLYVVNSSGTKVATLKTLGNSGTTLEFISNATHRTHTGANAAALTSYACAAGDRIVAEIGFSNSTGGTTPEASAKWGENATDATLADNATTADRAGWIEFSGTIAFQATPVTGTLQGDSASAGTLIGRLGKLAALVGDGVSTGALAALRGILAVLAAVAGSASTFASLVGRTGLIPGTSASTGTLTGSIEEPSDTPVTGALSGVSLTSGTLASVVGRIGPVAGAATSQGSLASEIARPVTMSGSATSAGTLTATTTSAAPCANGGRAMGLGLGL